MPLHSNTSRGFTLIELSIVLVIIGLIVGGILVGRDLIKAAEARSQITQIEKFQTAVNTFRGKFGALPGDMSLSAANRAGFTTDASCDGSSLGDRDGNGLIDTCQNNSSFLGMNCGETQLFWQDLSSDAGGNLIQGKFPNSGAANATCSAPFASNYTMTPGSTYIGDLLPEGKIGYGTFVYAYEQSGYNWFGLNAINTITTNAIPWPVSSPIPVIEAYNMDKKVDDGLPTTGRVQTYYDAASAYTLSNPSATDNTLSCVSGASVPAAIYSISSLADYGTHGNCALSFRFQ